MFCWGGKREKQRAKGGGGIYIVTGGRDQETEREAGCGLADGLAKVMVRVMVGVSFGVRVGVGVRRKERLKVG